MKKNMIWETAHQPNWCPGCGNFGLWQAFKQALTQLGKEPGETVLVAGIGCHGHINNFTACSSFEGLHGRPLPVATGIKLANHRLEVIVSTGDGDCLGEGGNHLIHACRRNHNLMVMLHNNASYSLTTGQTSPASPQGYVSKSTPAGKLEPALNPLAVAIGAGATFVARGFTGNVPQLTELFVKAIAHRGLAVVDVLQPCIVFNKQFTFDYFRTRVQSTAPAASRPEALKKALVWGKEIYTGVLFKEERPAYEDLVTSLAHRSLVENKPSVVKDGFLTEEFY